LRIKSIYLTQLFKDQLLKVTAHLGTTRLGQLTMSDYCFVSASHKPLQLKPQRNWKHHWRRHVRIPRVHQAAYRAEISLAGIALDQIGLQPRPPVRDLKRPVFNVGSGFGTSRTNWHV